MGVFERSKPLHKVVHDISLVLTQTLPTSVAPFSPLTTTSFLPIQRGGASLHGHKRCAERLEPRRDATQRLALPPLLLVFARAEVSLAPRRERSDRRTTVGFCVDDVGLEREWVDELRSKNVFRSVQSDAGLGSSLCVWGKKAGPAVFGAGQAGGASRVLRRTTIDSHMR